MRRPTKRQLEYLSALGYRGETPATIQEASDLITELKSQRGQSEFRWEVFVFFIFVFIAGICIGIWIGRG